MKYTVIICSLLITAATAYAQEDMPALTSADFPEAEFTENREYVETNLWGYINGGADLYLEYGFDRLLLQRIRQGKYHYKVEIYRMLQPRAARGIFSAFRFGCDKQLKGMPLSCVHDYQIMFTRSVYFINVVNETGTEEEKAFCRELAQAIAIKCMGEDYSLPALFRHEGLKEHLPGLKILTGRLALESSLTDWSVHFRGFEDYTLLVLPFEKEGIGLRLAQMTFTHEEQANMVLESIGAYEALQTDGSVGVTQNRHWMVRYAGPMGIIVLESVDDVPLPGSFKELLKQQIP